jgi:hypothetical protein
MIELLGLAPDCKFAARWIDKVKAAAARKRKDGSGNDAACLDNSIEYRLEVIDSDHREWSRQCFPRITL